MNGDKPQVKYLIIPNMKLDPDIYLAMHALVDAMLQKNAQVDIAIKQIPESLTSNLSLGEAKVVKSIPKQRFMLNFPGQKSDVKTIQWNQNKDNVNIYIAMNEGDFNPAKMTFSSIGDEYKQIILIGVNSFSDIGELYSKDTEYIFKNTKNISIGSKFSSDVADIESKVDEKNMSVVEDMYKYMKDNSWELNEMRANDLLAGIFYATKNFTTNLKDAQTFLTCAELIKTGASNSQAQALLSKVNTKQPKSSSSGENTEETKESKPTQAEQL